MQNNVNLLLLKILSDCIFDNHPEFLWNSLSATQQLEIIAEADNFKLRRILYYYLKNFFPKEIIRDSKVNFVSFAAKSMQREKAIEELQNIFKENKIEFRLLKGAFLISCIYPHAALRDSCDIDLLVKESDSQRAFELTSAHGWIVINKNRDKTSHHLPRQCKKNVSLEIHTTLFGNLKNENKKLWCEFSRRNPNIELHLLHILNHAVRDHNLINVETALIDVGFILKYQNIDIAYLNYLEDTFKSNGLLALFLNSFSDFFSPSEFACKTQTPDVIKKLCRSTIFDSSRSLGNKTYINTFFRRGYKNFLFIVLRFLASFSLYRMSRRYSISKMRTLLFYPYYFIKTFLSRIQEFFQVKKFIEKDISQDQLESCRTAGTIQDYIDRQN